LGSSVRITTPSPVEGQPMTKLLASSFCPHCHPCRGGPSSIPQPALQASLSSMRHTGCHRSSSTRRTWARNRPRTASAGLDRAMDARSTPLLPRHSEGVRGRTCPTGGVQVRRGEGTVAVQVDPPPTPIGSYVFDRRRRPKWVDGSLRCSCCGRRCGHRLGRVKKLIAAPGVDICDRCVGLCMDIIEKERTPSR
jgi:ClpX C4-type zinc finger